MREHLTFRKKIPMALVGPLVVGSTPVSVDINLIPNGASGAFISNSGGPVHFSLHQVELSSWTDPTTAIGVPINTGEYIEVYDNLEVIRTMRFVRTTSTDGIISFQFVNE